MRARTWVMAAALALPSAWAQPRQTRYIPALAYGPKLWSIIRLTNSGIQAGTVGVDVYREDGTRLPMEPTFDVQAGASREIRINGATASDEVCWARVTLPDGVEARGFVEILEGNALEDFTREAHEISGRSRWVTYTSAVAGKYMFFLNAGPEPTVVTFCAADQPQPDACKKRGTKAVRVPAGPNQLIGIKIRRPRRRFFITESSAPGAGLVTLFDAGPGDKRFFGSKSTVEFGEAEP